jgi:2-dehydro-3-deoxygalactonokinase
MADRIIVDWGTSSFRAYRFDAGGAAEVRRTDGGILAVEGGRFEEALRAAVGDWLTPGVELHLSGMITSRNGWVETPYVETPATLADLAAAAVRRDIAGGVSLRFLPGVSQREPSPDVMRGEEIQVFGAFRADESGVAVLPGTHSKWVRVERGRITGFRTFMTGEVFAVMRRHSILGRLIPEGAPALPGAFVDGVRQAMRPDSPGLLGDLFSARSGALLGVLAPEEIEERLSGLIVGHEIAGAVALGWAAGRVVLIGEAALCGRYATAFEACGVEAVPGPADAAVAGFRRLDALE